MLFGAAYLAGALSLAGQTSRILRFEPSVIEIDTVRYDAGPVKVRFTCTNICDKPVSIVAVNSQCGCAKPSFSRAAIRPGAKGYVDVVLDPSSLFAEQNRHLTVIATNGDYRKFNTITVHGYVSRDVSEEEVRYPYELVPGLRSEVDVLGMRLNTRGEVSEKEFTVYNSTSGEVSLKWASDWKNVKVEMPSSLASHSAARVRVWLDTAKMPSGAYEESMYIYVNGIRGKILLKGAVK